MRIATLFFIRSGVNLAVFGVIFGVLSFVRTQRFRQRTGVNPWHIPPVVWVVGSFFIAIFGTVLSVIACATTKVPGAPGGGSLGYGGGFGTPGYGPRRSGPRGYGTSGPVPTSGGNPGPVPTYGAGLGDAAVMASFPGPLPGATAAGPGWHPDPVGRHQHRYWDGTAWTEHVADNGTSGVDPV